MKELWKKVWAWARSRKLEQSFFELAQGDLVEKAKICLLAREERIMSRTQQRLLEHSIWGKS